MSSHVVDVGVSCDVLEGIWIWGADGGPRVLKRGRGSPGEANQLRV